MFLGKGTLTYELLSSTLESEGGNMTTISAKIDNIDKNLFENILNSIGLNVSSAITAFVKATIRENGMPFALKASEDPYVYSEENMKYLRQAVTQIESGKGHEHELREDI